MHKTQSKQLLKNHFSKLKLTATLHLVRIRAGNQIIPVLVIATLRASAFYLTETVTALGASASYLTETVFPASVFRRRVAHVFESVLVRVRGVRETFLYVAEGVAFKGVLALGGAPEHRLRQTVEPRGCLR